jgi:acetoin utilization protein AcuB
MRVEKWMTRKPVSVVETTPLIEAWRLCREQGIRHLPVVRGGQVVGMLSDRDLRNRVWPDVNDLHAQRSGTVADVMTKGVVTVKSDDSVTKTAMVMHNLKISGLPVVNRHQELIGIITIQDLLEVLVSLLPEPVEVKETAPPESKSRGWVGGEQWF